MNPCGPLLSGPALPGVDRDRDAGHDQDGDRHDERRQAGQLHLLGLDLLPQVLGRSPDHQSADEHRDDGVDEDRVEPAPGAAGGHLPEHHAGQQAQAAHRGERVVGGVRRPVEVLVEATPNRAVLVSPKRTSLPSVLPVEAAGDAGGERRPGCPGARRRQVKPTQTPKMMTIAAEQRGAVADAAHHLAEGVGQGERDDEQQEDGQPVGEPRRVLEGGAPSWRSRNPPPLVPSCLMASMKPIGPTAMVWVTPLSASWIRSGAGKGLDRALADEDDAGHKGDRQQDVEHAPGDVDPEVPDGRRVPPGEAAHQSDGDSDTDRRR